MNRHYLGVFACALLLACGSVLAADTQNSAGSQNATEGQNAGLIDPAKLTGDQVNDLSGQQLGTVKELLFEPLTGRIRYAVISVDPSNNVAVPWQALRCTRQGEGASLALDATKDKLQNAPKWKEGDADRLYTKEAGKPIYDYWAIIWTEEPAPVGEQPNPNASPVPGVTGSTPAATTPAPQSAPNGSPVPQSAPSSPEPSAGAGSDAIRPD